MAQIPTFTELRNGIIQNLEAEFGFTITTFGKPVLATIATVQAAKLKLYWLAIAEVLKNIFVDTSDEETLLRFGQVKLGRLPFQATQGLYTVSVLGDVAAVVPAGTVFKANDDSASPGKFFILDVQKTIATMPDSMQLRALTAGPDSRLSVSDQLTSTSPLLNIDDIVVVAVEDEIPLNAENIEDYRQTVINAFRLESQGGAATDYRLWAADAQGVRFVYPYVKSGECGVIDLYVEANQADSADLKGTPTAQILSDVEEVIEFDPDDTKPLEERGRRPLGVHQINILSITPLDVIITFVNAVNFTPETESNVTQALTDLINDIRPFVPAADIIENKNDVLDINRVIATAQELLTSDQKFDSVTMTVDGNPVTTSITFTDGDIPFLDQVNY